MRKTRQISKKLEKSTKKREIFKKKKIRDKTHVKLARRWLKVREKIAEIANRVGGAGGGKNGGKS